MVFCSLCQLRQDSLDHHWIWESWALQWLIQGINPSKKDWFNLHVKCLVFLLSLFVICCGPSTSLHPFWFWYKRSQNWGHSGTKKIIGRRVSILGQCCVKHFKNVCWFQASLGWICWTQAYQPRPQNHRCTPRWAVCWWPEVPWWNSYW